ncbi:TMEM175 family protein [Flammeovirga sp. OC4]|uniref:TMEM175 family protein n=1 Tax=Flammeovirga sp. OC4 TaxID=1382345 RepID=UPI0005C75746|nr:TMEM175 family protein [Flammeovirga sp. OC4]
MAQTSSILNFDPFIHQKATFLFMSQQKIKKPAIISESWLFRINRLSDIIFATSMTMLLLAFDFSSIDDVKSNKQLLKALSKQLPILGIYLTTFILLAVYWLKHTTTTRLMKGADSKYMWLDIITLAFVALLPFSNSLATAFPDFYAAIFLYSVNVMIIGGFSYSSWRYATHYDRLLKEPLEKEIADEISQDKWMEPLLAFISLIVAYFYIDYAQVPYILVPVIYGLRTKWIEYRSTRAR